jgi:hypothetical protein
MSEASPSAGWGAVTPSASGVESSGGNAKPVGASGGVRAYLYTLLEEPSSSTAAQMIASFILLCIVVSIVALVLESDPKIRQPYQTELSNIEIATTVVFTVEYVVRLSVCGVGGLTVKKFILAPTNLIDLCAIVPFYVEYFFKGGDVKFLKVLRAIRLIRLFRVFKVGRFKDGVRVMFEAIWNSWHALNTLCFFVAVAMILFSSAVYYSEKLMCPIFDASEASQLEFMQYEEGCRLGIPGSYICCDYACNPENPGVVKYPENLDTYRAWGMQSDAPGNASVSELIKSFPNTLCVYSLTDEEWKDARREAQAQEGGSISGFERRFIVTVVSSNTYKSIPHSFWWSIVSMTTTGFGDEVPETPVGKIFAIIAMCFGILLIALPVAIVGSKFQEAFAQMEIEQAKQREKALEKVRRSITKAGTETAPTEPDAPPPVEVPPEESIDVDELATTFFPRLAHLVQEVPEGHPAHASVDRVAHSYEELAAVQAEILATQMKFVQNQQLLGPDLGVIFSNADEHFMAQNAPPKRVVNPKPDPI